MRSLKSLSSGAILDRLRADIDQGETGDKVPYGDPAAAPLGTDDEFADVSSSPSLVARTACRNSDSVRSSRRSARAPSDTFGFWSDLSFFSRLE